MDVSDDPNVLLNGLVDSVTTMCGELIFICFIIVVSEKELEINITCASSSNTSRNTYLVCGSQNVQKLSRKYHVYGNLTAEIVPIVLQELNTR